MRRDILMRWLTGIVLYLLSMQLAMADTTEKLITLTIDLQHGFRGQSVTVQMDGRDVVKSEAVTTDPSMGFAKRYTYKTRAG